MLRLTSFLVVSAVLSTVLPLTTAQSYMNYQAIENNVRQQMMQMIAQYDF